VPETLRNRKLKLEFYYKQVSGASFTVDVLDGSSNPYSLSTDVSGTTTLANTSGKFTCYFDTNSTSSLRVQLTSTGAGVTKVTQIIVGPGIQPQGAVVGEWQSYTPSSTQGWGTVTLPVFFYKRVGSSIIIKAKFVAGTTDGNEARISLPTGLTSGTTNTLTMVGAYARDTSTAATANQVYIENGVSYLTFGRADGTVAGYTKRAGNVLASSGENIGFTTAEIPISEWAGSGTVNLAQNDVEYAYNSDSTTSAGHTADTGFAYGPQGVNFLGIVSTTTGYSLTKKRVRFQTPVRSTDKIEIEISGDNGTTWSSLGDNADVIPLDASGNYVYGMGIVPINTTDVYVQFGNGGRTRSETSTVFSAAGQAWTEISGNRKWRLKKSSAGAAVGFGIVQPGVSSGLVSASGLPGNTTGNAIASGYVGERLAPLTETFAVSVSNTGAGSELKSLTLTPGVWMVYGFAVAPIGTLSGPQYSTLVLTTTSNSFNAVDNREGACQLTINGNSFNALVLQCVRYMNISSSQTIYLCARQGATSGSSTWVDLNGRSMYAIRIA
jgi:hypothetical protein